MKNRFSLNITTVVGVALAVVTFLLALTFLGSSEQTTTLYVATQDIGATKAVTSSMVASRSVPSDSVPAGALTQASDIIGRYAIDNIYEGEVITDRRIAEGDIGSAQILTENLGPDTRLISIQADVSAAIAGRIKTGDIVDVIAVVDGFIGADPAGGAVGGGFAQTIIQQAQVVDVNLPQDALQAAADRGAGDQLVAPSNPADTGSGPVIPGIYTLAVTSEQAKLLALADSSGTLYLVLTPPNAAPSTGGPAFLNAAEQPGQVAPRVSSGEEN